MAGNLYLLMVAAVINFLVFTFLKRKNLLLISELEYIGWFIIIPAIGLAAITAMGLFLSARIRPESRLANYIPVLQMALMCFVVAASNFDFTVTLCVLCFPVFITVIFNDWKMTRNIMLLSLFLLTLALMVRQIQTILPYKKDYLLPEGIVTAGIIISAGIACKILLEFQQERERIIRRAYESRHILQERLNRDPKTGLYTAKAFFSILKEVIEEGEGESVVLAVIDIDDFKKVNDTYGHSNGDKVLERLAQLLLKYESDKIIPSRFGGEEFSVIFKTEPGAAYKWTENLRLRFAAEKYEFMPARVTISCGIAAWKKEWTDEQLFANADQAMYDSKQRGKNLVSIFNAKLMKNGQN